MGGHFYEKSSINAPINPSIYPSSASGRKEYRHHRDIFGMSGRLPAGLMVNEISEELISEWKAHFMAQNYVPTTINAKLPVF